MIVLSDAGSKEPLFTHLFRGCLLFESLLKKNPDKPPKQSTLGLMLKHDFAKDFDIPATFDGRETDFGNLVQLITPKQSISTATECTAKARNTLGHNLVWAAQSLDRSTYDLLAHDIAAACLHAIAKLYARLRLP